MPLTKARLEFGGPITAAAKGANATLAASFQKVLAAGSIRFRRVALQALAEAVRREESRLRHEDTQHALAVASEEWERAIAPNASSGPDLGAELERLTELMNDVLSEKPFQNYTASAEDIARVQAALRKGAGPRWGLAFLAERTGALGEGPPKKQPTDDDLERRQRAVKQTLRRA